MPPRKGCMLIRGDNFRRFWSYVVCRGDCLIWIGDRTSHFGHGKFTTTTNGQQRHHKAHRWIYEQLVGPAGKVLRYSCNNPACVNIEHLIPGTQLDNVHDAIRAGSRKGTPPAIVRQIRRAYDSGESPTRIAARLGMPMITVWHIAKRETWAHLPDEESS